MSGNRWWSTKVCPKVLFDLVMFSIFSSNIPLDFHESIRVEPLKYLMYFLAGVNTKQSWNITEKKILCSIMNTKFIYQIFCEPFCWYCFSFFFDSSFNLFLFDVTFFSLLSKSVFILFYEIHNIIFAC